ncbi:MAG: hypothetical protein ATN36_02755 [Epulopiscium sp. Nele67-Bin005]|nr:MAG: hypothetical protein ATN36_02755 [Epulopiscium sp. Nele67-Bin005]
MNSLANIITDNNLLIILIDIVLMGVGYFIYDIIYTFKTQKLNIWQPLAIYLLIQLAQEFYSLFTQTNIVMDILIFISHPLFIYSLTWKMIYCHRKILGHKAKYIWTFWGGTILIPLLLLSMLTISDLKSNFKSVTTTELQNILDNISLTEDSIIYIGRPTCPACEIAKPKLEELIDTYKIPAYYYNTDVARDDDEATMTELLNSLEITSVPTIISLKGNVVYDILNGDDIDTQLENFLDNNYLPLI